MSALPLGLRVWAAARLVPLQAPRGTPPGRLVGRFRSAPAGEGAPTTTAERIVEVVTRSTARPWLMRHRRCLREGLLAYRFLGEAGYAPTIHFSILRTTLGQKAPMAHCWVSVDGKAIVNPPTPEMVELVAYGADGSRCPGPMRHGVAEVA